MMAYPTTFPYATLHLNTNASTGGYRVEAWPTTTSNTSLSATSAWPYYGGTGASVQIQYAEYNTFGSLYTQAISGPTIIIRYDNNGWTHINYGTASSYQSWARKSPAERLKEILNSRMAPNVLSACRPLGYTTDVREMRARETLRRVLGEDKFRYFVRRGSVSVRAKSGLVYQIFPGSAFTNVYDCGKMIEKLCVVLTGGFPPTDSLIMRYLMILNNEQQFRSYAIKHGISQPSLPAEADQRSLVEIFKELKKVA